MHINVNDRDAVPVLTPADMRAVEQKAFGLGVPSLLLMEQAAHHVTDALCEMLDGGKSKRVLFVCGSGNNGGDGLAAARLFALKGGKAEVLLQKHPKTEDAGKNLAFAKAMGIAVYAAEDEELRHFASGYDAYVDALLGTGISGAPDEKTAALIELMNRSKKPVLSVDIPSGMDGKSGACPGVCVQADVTVCFHAVKPGLLLTEHREWTGKIIPVDIGMWGMEDTLRDAVQEMHGRILAPAALKCQHSKPLSSHKGNGGRIGIFAGSMGLCGAAAMCAKAALQAGGGLVTLLCPGDCMPVLQKLVPGAMCMEIEKALAEKPMFDVLVMGCGLGQTDDVWQKIKALYDPAKPTVWDADALNLLAKDPFVLGEKAVMTPHPGEAARLLGCSIGQVLENRPLAAQKLCETYGCTVVLKSDVTVICRMDNGKPEYIFNAAGTPAMAKGGSGDVLAGMLGAVLHREQDPLQAAGLSCLWHGLSGEAGEKRFGMQELTAETLIECFYEARKET